MQIFAGFPRGGGIKQGSGGLYVSISWKQYEIRQYK